ncbi:hypothetical protein [Abyssalbus ytuae]|uniref:Uncharacterized protein n=1 Tax=Abyssalbus ytuae TaxID=2926907 RepID=A0A9E7D4B5_9FLAO|nr:hypothetical protein [Abyssalbus ytuae]UOB18729.1 hypothetical protein MQE35_05410 [Abyssalbus ytuae]
MKYFRIFEIAYLVIAIISFVEVFKTWSEDRNRAYLFLIFGVFSAFMFFFRRYYRNKFSNRNKQ